MASKLDIFNLALGRIGSDRTVASTGEQSKENANCTRVYDQCLSEVLEASAWPFAVKTVALARLADDGKLQGWGYQFQRPTDALRLLEIVAAEDAGSSANYWCTCSGPWSACGGSGCSTAYREALANDGNSTVILSNLETPVAVYVAKISNPAVLSALFVSVLADRLGMEIAMPITADRANVQMMLARYNSSFTTAASSAFEQTKQGPDGDSPAIRARS